MVADEVSWLGTKSQEMLDNYDRSGTAPGLPTFESVEVFWEESILPRIGEFASMQADFGLGSTVPRDSVWAANTPITRKF